MYYCLTVVSVIIESSAEAVAQSVKFRAQYLHSNIAGCSTKSRT